MREKFATQPKLPIGPLVEWCDRQWLEPNGEHGHLVGETGKITTMLGVSRATVHRWQKHGVPLYVVDEALTRAGASLWDVWVDPHMDLVS